MVAVEPLLASLLGRADDNEKAEAGGDDEASGEEAITDEAFWVMAVKAALAIAALAWALDAIVLAFLYWLDEKLKGEKPAVVDEGDETVLGCSVLWIDD